jgi:penicillin-binding protein 1C
LRGIRPWLGAGLLALGLTAQAAQTLPSFEQVRDEHGASEARLVDRHGEPLAEIRLDPTRRRLEWMPLAALSPAMKEALLAAEDRRFYQHAGVDWRAFAAAVWQNLWYDRARGASTLSMQLAGLLDPALRPIAGHGGRRTLGQKWDQALAATELERLWSKAQILEAYLNLAPFRGELEGLPAAAWGLFRRGPGELSRPEAAILAVLLRGPNAAPGLVGRRACALVRRLGEAGACPLAEGLARSLAQARFEPRWALAPHLARALLSRPGEVLPTTLDRATQALARARLAEAGGRGGLVVVDNASGQVLAHLGSADGSGPDETRARRPLGGLIQPLVHGLALEQRLVTPASLLEADPAADSPRWLSVRTALLLALPGPASQLAARLAPGVLEERLRLIGLGVESLPAGTPVEARAMGDLPGLAGLFRGLAAGGQWQSPQWQMDQAPAAARLLRPETAFLVTQMLAGAGEAGPEVAVYGGGPSASGGGLAVAFDSGASVAVWLDSGAEPAQSLARRLLAELPRAMPAPGWRPPSGVVAYQVAFDPPVEPPRREWFLRGTELSLAVAPGRRPLIRWPTPGLLVDARAALADPAYQLRFEARPALPGLAWRLNGRPLGSGPQAGWRPEAGLVSLELLGPDGAVVDRVEFAVRGP